MSDFTELPNHIADCLESAGPKLSEDQRLLLAGYLAPVQLRVKELEAINLGLTKTLVEMEAENAELREAVARCRYQASFIIGSPESLREIMRKIREIANEALADDEGEA